MATYDLAPNPSEHGWPFATGPGQVVTQGHWQTMTKTWQSNGVIAMPEQGPPSAGNAGLTAVRASEAVVTVQPGSATINGFYYDLKSPKDFSLDITGADFTDDGTGKMIRRDLVVLKVDAGLGEFRFVQIKNGVNNLSGSWRVNLTDPGTEIPLVQVDIEQGVGVAQVVDRRWFISRSVKPLKFEQPGYEPVPRDGELGVDVTGSRLVIGKNGAWVSAREVFTNDIPTELTTRLSTVETTVASHTTQLSTITTNYTSADTAIKAKLTSTPVTLAAPVDNSWINTGTTAYVFGPTLYINLVITRKNSDFAGNSSAGTKLATFSDFFTLPSGLTIAADTYAHAYVSTVVTVANQHDIWVRLDTLKELVLWKCPPGIKLNGVLRASLAVPLAGFTW
ncbi:hypothetical protein [Nonomuraea sp. NPDC049129]|uniref:hypothetical protein n=1 Tax=Nonomuraea sp. NPDC049129 TaxID=3155272 RepID=UPI0033FCA1F2